MTLPVRIGRPGRAGPGTTIRSAYQVPRLLSGAWRRLASLRARRRDLRAGLGLAPRERLLDAVPGPDGTCTLAATDRALYHRAHNGAWTRLGWETITAVTWAAGRARVTGLWGDSVVPVAGPLGGLPEIAAERITHTRLGSWRISVGASRPVHVEARRRPGTGEVLWFVDPGISRSDAARVIARLGAQAGVPPQDPVTLPWR